MEEYRLVPLGGKHGNGNFALVSVEDYAAVTRFNWFVKPSRKTTYACRDQYDGHGRKKRVYMHHLVRSLRKGFQVDHIDGNGLNNTRQNLRLVTKGQNQMNIGAHADSTSKYKGVCWAARDRRWLAQIMANGKKRNLGGFLSEEEAARAYDKHAKELHGEYAVLNFP